MNLSQGLAEAVDRVDWDRPWLGSVQTHGRALHASIVDGNNACTALNSVDSGCSTVAFVPADRLTAGMPYETYIHHYRSVPTRDNLHDLFNGLIWLAFPRTKRLLNRWQTNEIARTGGACGPRRGALRDALTLLDENGAFLQAPDALWQALAARAWKRLFIELRPLWQDARLTLFGHALLEKLVRPRKSITAHVLRWPLDSGPSELTDDLATANLSPQRLLCRPVFMPLPVLGVPGWWPENETAAFYDDAEVFRPLNVDRFTAGQPPDLLPT